LTVLGLVLWRAYQFRLQQLARQLNLGFQERLSERTRIAQDLHDTLLQNIAGLCLQIGGLSKVLAGHPELTKERLKDLRQQGEHCMREARKAVWNIRSLESERLDLPTELRESGERLTAGTPTRFISHCEGEPQGITLELRDQILRISQEAISNAARHARADTIELRVIFEAKCLQLRISDNGRGFDTASASELRGHFGLITMRERAIGIGASITVSSEPACGTCIDVKVPL
jgi:signal transduction histidine kinase